jgi:hypothetical protein
LKRRGLVRFSGRLAAGIYSLSALLMHDEFPFVVLAIGGRWRWIYLNIQACLILLENGCCKIHVRGGV